MKTDTTQDCAVEKFATSDLSGLRKELKQAGLDSWQAAELISSFLMLRGYGVSNQAVRGAVTKIEGAGCTLEHMQRELEKLALVM
jgi:hypothetical protein